MSDHQLTMLTQMVSDGIDLDGLSVERQGSGFRVRAEDHEFTCSTSDELEERLADYDHLVSNWYFWNVDVQESSASGWHFLRWLEHSAELTVSKRYDRMEQEELSRRWGELTIAVRLNEKGERVYDVSHHSDRDRDLHELDVHVDPLDARYIAKYDDEGTYRPLKGAPSLKRGWMYPGLRHEKLLKTVHFLYPASIVNWYLEREDRLDVTHYREAADRHTGMFEVIDRVDEEQLETVTSHCCTDDSCIKRRRWEETADKEIDVDPGDGEIPCREPCQVMIDEARDLVTSNDSHDH